MPKVKIISAGYADKKNNRASSVATLVQDNNLNIIVDPGIDRSLLMKALAENKLKTSDINYIIITHFHADHCALMGIFENAKIVDIDEICSFAGQYEDHNGQLSNSDIQIISTPGHDNSHCSVLATDDELGMVAIAGDVFWWWDDEPQITAKADLLNRVDPYVKNADQILKSRQKLLESARYIIPGHGKMFKTERGG